MASVSGSDGDDPVRALREQYRRLADLGQKLGYALIALAVVVFMVGFFTGFSSWVVGTIVAALLIGSVVLLPAIIVGYAVKAADREDRELGR